MKKLLLALLIVAVMAATAFAAGPAIEEQNMMQFTAADQESTAKFAIDYIVWASFTGSEIVTTNVLNLENGGGIEIFKMMATTGQLGPIVIPMGGLVVMGLKAEDLTKGYVTVYGTRR